MAFQWKLNGVNIPGALQPTFTIPNVQSTNAGAYNVVVYDNTGAVDSETANLIVTNLPPLPSSNTFALRGSLGSALFGSVRGNNFGATKEPGETNHVGNPGGSSVWVKWIAPPMHGIATFNVRGSGFDTVLAAYTGNALTNLVPVGGSDDDAGFLNSAVRFNALSGVEYNIAIDGFYGDQGNIVLNWSTEITPESVPEILIQPQSRTVFPNGPASLSVTVTNTGIPPQYQWFFQDGPIFNATNSILDIPVVTMTEVGPYRVRVRYLFFTNRDTFSSTAFIQINGTSGGTSDPKAAAQAKFRQNADTNSGPGFLFNKDFSKNAAPASGFTGTQIFNTYGSVKEPGEPNHCGEPGGASYWFSYQAPANGMLTVDTFGTTFNNVLAVYTGPGTSFVSLVPVACSSINNGSGNEITAFSASSNTVYYIANDGVGGITGIVTLNYNLATNPPTAPMITIHPQSQTVAPGSNVTLTVSATGSAPLRYQWRTNAVTFPAKTNASLTLTNFQTANQATYDVIVTNTLGAVTSSPAILYLNSPLRFTNSAAQLNVQFSSLLIGAANTNYIIEATTNLTLTNWIPLRTNTSSTGLISFADTNVVGFGQRYYRARTP